MFYGDAANSHIRYRIKGIQQSENILSTEELGYQQFFPCPHCFWLTCWKLVSLFILSSVLAMFWQAYSVAAEKKRFNAKRLQPLY
jgi:hypothetical protein